jgi:prolyl-tRNA synthetase
MAKTNLVKKSENMSDWYTGVIGQSKLADYAPVKGCVVLRPGSYHIWESIQAALNLEFAKLKVENAYFPLFIPMSFLKREAQHVEGFAPELAVVTIGGGKKLAEELAVRPTSETIMYAMYSKWINSWRDLPLKLNQWNNVVRWEKRTYFFLRTMEFLWQEAHTAHATHEEAMAMVLDALTAYRRVSEELLAIPVVCGYKSSSERFAGADCTTTIEAMMPDGKALQAGTSHDLGQNFSKKSAFNIAFQNRNGETDYVWQTSFGMSTRILGALILQHGDDDGLVLPPMIAQKQIEIILAAFEQKIVSKAKKIVSQLEKQALRVRLNDDNSNSLGFKLNEAELRGVPVTIVFGKKELEEQKLTLTLRHTHEKIELPIKNLAQELPKILTRMQIELLEKAKAQTLELTHEAKNYDQFKQIMNSSRGFIKAHWCENPACEAAIKEETKASTRCLPFINEKGEVAKKPGKCIYCGKPAEHEWLFAQAY